MVMSPLKKLTFAAIAAVAFGTSASASCTDGLYCNSGLTGSSFAAPVSSSYGAYGAYGSSYGAYGSYAPAESYGYATSNSVVPSYDTGYGSYSVAPQTASYTTTSAGGFGNSSNLSILDFEGNGRLCEVNCPVNVHNPEGGIVLDCYRACEQPVEVVNNYVRVIRPIIQVPTPVPTPVPVPVPVDVPQLRSFGGFSGGGFQGGYAGGCFSPAVYQAYYGC